MIAGILVFIFCIGLWIGFGFLCDYLGKQKGQKNCFWYGFFLGIIGLIIVLCLKDKSGEISNNSSSNKYEDLAKLQELKENETITEVEFEIEKQKLLR